MAKKSDLGGNGSPSNSDNVEEASFVPITQLSTRTRVQIRVEEPGRAKRDGRRGRILLESDDAPAKVVQWLKDPKTRKADTATGGALYIWIDDKLWSGVSEDAPDADARTAPTTAPSAVALPADLAISAEYQRRIEQVTRSLEDALQAAREEHRREIAALREARDREVSTCNAQIEAARERLSTELKREDEELANLSARRTAYGEDRRNLALSLAQDVQVTAVTREILSGKLLQTNKTWLEAGVDALRTPQGAMIAAGVASKLGLPPELVGFFMGGQQTDPQTPQGG